MAMYSDLPRGLRQKSNRTKKLNKQRISELKTYEQTEGNVASDIGF